MHHVLIVEPNREQRTVERLRERGYEAYTPRQWKRRTHRGRVIEFQRPMFPGYAFIRAPVPLEWIESIRGVRRYMRVGETSVRLPEGAIAAIKQKEAREAARFCSRVKESEFNVGQTVKITVGPWADILAHVERLDDKGRVEVLFRMMGADRTAWVDRNEVIAA